MFVTTIHQPYNVILFYQFEQYVQIVVFLLLSLIRVNTYVLLFKQIVRLTNKNTEPDKMGFTPLEEKNFNFY